MRLNKRTLAISTATLVAAGGISAFAFVTAGGEGSGSAGTASADSIKNVEFTPTVTGLEPNGTAEIALAANNPNTYTVTIHSLTVAKADPTDLPEGCDADDFTVTSPTLPEGGIDIAPGDTASVTGFSTAGTVHLEEDTTDACMGATLSLTVS